MFPFPLQIQCWLHCKWSTVLLAKLSF